ncbi:RloB domain-containing protein [Streptomyces sp. A0958]|uniref:RloB family protein n=1 Tax=Streptomyces sp. A0958 TaxID=2563101 RepID=UPI00109E6AA5|nr:RloB family protein [Streptomyces sp. A0958]THA72723.1 RloB domain-containing protein [Streptomyces sp. A0958]
MARHPKPDGRKRPSRESRLGRRTEHRAPRLRLLVVCGAEVTEYDYVQGLKGAARNSAVSIKVVTHPKAPSQVVAYTAKLFGESDDAYDAAWCVVDVDEFTDLADALGEAERQGIGIALSNPCFEVWLLLHFTDHHKHMPSYAQLAPLLSRHVPGGYSKTGLDFRHYASGWTEAVRRARLLAPEGKELEVNPSTGMWKLALAIGGPAQ